MTSRFTAMTVRCPNCGAEPGAIMQYFGWPHVYEVQPEDDI